jgi:hypothetical protein
MKSLLLLVISHIAWAGWKHEVITDKMTDKKEVHFVIKSKNSVHKGKKAELGLITKCGTDFWQMIISHPRVVKIDLPVSIRFDKTEQQEVKSSYASDYKGWFLGDTEGEASTDILIDRIKAATIVLVSYYDIGGYKQVAEFDVKGLDLKVLDKVCK